MYRFLDMTFHPENGVLETGSGKQMLRPKTAQILVILIDHAHELVTKEHLLETVWSDCHVSSGSLVQSIQEIRRALGDSAKQPRFIQTFPRRGYQWLVPVTRDDQILPTSANQQKLAITTLSKSEVTDTAESVAPEKTSVPKTMYLAFGLLAVVATLLWLGWLTGSDAIPQVPTTSRTRLAMLPVVDQTQNPSLEWMGPGISELLRARLQETDKFHLLSQVQLGETRSKLGFGPSALDDSQAQKLLKNVDGHMLLQGHIQLAGSQFRYVYRLTKAEKGTAEGSFSFANPLDISHKLSELLAAHPQPKTHGLRFSNLEQANQDYFRGKLALDTKSAPLAKRYFEAALLLDPEFETCRLALARTIYLMGDLPEAERLYHRVLDRSSETNQAYHRIIALQGLGRIDWRIGELDRSNERVELALALARDGGFPQLEARCLRLLSWHAMHVGHWKKHDHYQNLARELSADATDEKSTADALYYMGSSDSPHHNFEQGRHLLRMALDYYQKTGALSDLAYTYLALGKNRSHSPEQQASYHLQALEIFEQLGYHLVIPGVWEGLALAYAQQLKPLELKKYILMAHRIYEDEQHLGDLANTQFILAVAEIMIGLSQEDAPLADFLTRAEAWLDACYDFHQEKQITSRLGSQALLRGMIAMEREDLIQANHQFTRAVEIFDSLDFPEGIAVCAVAKAALALEQRQWQDALDWSARAENVYPQRPGLWQPYAIYAHLHLGQQDTALKLAEAYTQSARPSATATAQRFHEYCRKIQDGETAKMPTPPHVLNTYFQSY